jgi:hypothetical protein
VWNAVGVAVALVGGLLYAQVKQAPTASSGGLLDMALSGPASRFDKMRIV